MKTIYAAHVEISARNMPLIMHRTLYFRDAKTRSAFIEQMEARGFKVTPDAIVTFTFGEAMKSVMAEQIAIENIGRAA